MHLLLGEGGPLLDEYKQLASVTIQPATNSPTLAGPFTDKVLGKLGLWQPLWQKKQARQRAQLQQALQLDQIDLVLVNTVTSGHWFAQLALSDKIPVIAFVHELAMSVRLYTQAAELRHLLQRANRVLTVSKATARYYETQHGVPADKIVLFTLIDLPSLQKQISQARQLPNPMGQLGIPADAFIVGGCGNAEWRKGNDLFINLAALVTRKSKLPIYFVWVGMPEGNLHDELMLDVQKAGLTDRIRLVAPTPAVLQYMAHFSVLALTSREDPYPLVVLEAGLSKVPVLCFTEAGGAPELVGDDGGYVVPYLDLAGMAERIMHLAENAPQQQQMGQRLEQKVIERHSSNQSTQQLLDLIHQLTAKAL